MNGEEAIRHLETYSTTLGSGQTTQAQHEEAKRMAIKALEQEPTKEEMALLQKWRDNRGISMEEFEDAMNTLEQQPCGNAIDRAEAIKIASGYCHPANVAKELAKLTPVNPTKTGHWIGDAIQGEIDGQIVKGFTCSKCGAISVFRMTDGKIINGDLCANCGAKMIESQERSDKV